MGPTSGIVDLDCDGGRAEDSLRKLFGGEPPDTLSFASRRGRHLLFRYDPRFAELQAAFKSDEYPDLEFRLGGSKAAQDRYSTVHRRWRSPRMAHELRGSRMEVIAKIVAAAPKAEQRTTAPDDFLGSVGSELQAAKLQCLKAYFKPQYPILCRQGRLRLSLPFRLLPRARPATYRRRSVVYVNADGSHAFNCKHAKCTTRLSMTWKQSTGRCIRPSKSVPTLTV